MLQKVLAGGRLSAVGSTFARFAYASPAGLVVLGLVPWTRGQALPQIMPAFWGWALFGGLGQILATVFVVMTFRTRNFAVGITLKKTEVILTALGDHPEARMKVAVALMDAVEAEPAGAPS